jgi:hypothetical protein
MNEPLVFRPPRRRGLLFHLGAALALAATSGLAFIVGLDQQIGTYFILLLILSLALFAPLPLVIYRAYALARAGYWLERDGLRLHWGLRAEDIPLPEIQWVRRAGDLAARLPLPRLFWPGALLGSIHTADLGQVEYLASSTRTLVLIATSGRVYGISPEDPEAFVRAFQRTMEMGSLTPLSSISVLPAAYLSRVWADRLARWVLLGGLALTLLLFVSASLLIPTRTAISLGFSPDGRPLPGVPAERLILLPILGAFIYLTDLATGLFLYRRDASRPAAYLLWVCQIITAALFLAAVLNIIRVPV